MINLLMVFAILMLPSCSSFARAEWKIVDEPNEDKAWRVCSEKYDGIEYHHKGFCYIIKKCRKKFLRKEECLPVLQFCKFGDEACGNKYGLFNKRLM